MSLNAIFIWHYEFYFYTDDITEVGKFDTIYNMCTIEDPFGNRRGLVYDKCLEILEILSITPGIHICSSFVNYNNKRYKVTLYNTKWSGETPT
jgi:hypothetical protein